MFTALHNLQTLLTECTVLPLLNESSSPESFVEPDSLDFKTVEPDPPEALEPPKLSTEHELRIVLSKMVAPSSARNDLNIGTFRSDTPSASSVSVPDLSLAGNILPSEDLNQMSRRVLPPRRAKVKAIKEGKRLITNAISTKLALLHSPPKLSARKLLTKARPPSSEPPLKRMRIPCNCGTASCRKWLC